VRPGSGRGAVERLPGLVGRARALEIILTEEADDAQRTPAGTTGVNDLSVPFQGRTECDGGSTPGITLGHFRHWAGHQFGPGRDEFLEYVDSQHQEMHWLVEGCGWTEGVLIFLVGEFFDANVACGERWGLEPMERLRDTGSWTLAFELHRHGDRLCSGTAELNCELLGLAASFGALVSARALAYDGTPGVELGSWLVSPQDGITTRATTSSTSG
jgi:hypothetical protein